MAPKYMTVGDIEKKFGIKKSWVNALVADGRLKPAIDPGVPGQRRYYREKDVVKCLKNRDTRGKKHPDPKEEGDL